MVGAVDKGGFLLREGRPPNHDMSRGDGYVYIPSLELFQMLQGHESYGPGGIALRWMRGGTYGVLPELNLGIWTQVIRASAQFRLRRFATDFKGQWHGVWHGVWHLGFPRHRE